MHDGMGHQGSSRHQRAAWWLACLTRLLAPDIAALSMAMLLGAAKLLKAREAELHGRVALVFQPFEEGGAGGDLVMRSGECAWAKRRGAA